MKYLFEQHEYEVFTNTLCKGAAAESVHAIATHVLKAKVYHNVTIVFLVGRNTSKYSRAIICFVQSSKLQCMNWKSMKRVVKEQFHPGKVG